MVNYKLKGKIVERFGTATNFSKVLGTRESIISRVIRSHKNLPEAEQDRWANILGSKREDLFEQG